MKQRNGYVYRDGKSWVARLDFTDESGKRRVIRRYCETKTEANQKRRYATRRSDACVRPYDACHAVAVSECKCGYSA